jgi:hypothetical protein
VSGCPFIMGASPSLNACALGMTPAMTQNDDSVAASSNSDTVVAPGS